MRGIAGVREKEEKEEKRYGKEKRKLQSGTEDSEGRREQKRSEAKQEKEKVGGEGGEWIRLSLGGLRVRPPSWRVYQPTRTVNFARKRDLYVCVWVLFSPLLALPEAVPEWQGTPALREGVSAVVRELARLFPPNPDMN